MSQVEAATRQPLGDLTNLAPATHDASANTPVKQNSSSYSSNTTNPSLIKKSAVKNKPVKSSSTSSTRYSAMTNAAFAALSKPRSGVSRQAIVNYVKSIYHLDDKQTSKSVKNALIKMHENGEIKMCKLSNGREIDGPFNLTCSYKLVEKNTPKVASTRTAPIRKSTEPKTPKTVAKKQPATKKKAPVKKVATKGKEATKEKASVKTKAVTKQEAKAKTKSAVKAKTPAKAIPSVKKSE